MLQLSRKESYFSLLFQVETRRFEKKQKSIDVISIVSIKKNDCMYHMFVIWTLIIEKKLMCLRIMMNCDVIKIFIFQLKMKKLDINEFYVSIFKFKTFDDTTLRTYSNRILLIIIIDQANHMNFDRYNFIATNMMNIELILRLFSLMSQNFNIDWSAQTIRWRFFDESNAKN